MKHGPYSPTRHDMNLAWTGIIAVLFMICLSIAAITDAVTDNDCRSAAMEEQK